MGVLLLLTGCGEKVLLDNGTAQTWVVRLDDNTLRIAPESSLEMRLDKGPHTLQYRPSDSASTDTSVSFDIQGEMFIHAPGSRYLIWKDLYGSQEKRKELLNEEIFEWDSAEYRVDVTWLDTQQVVHLRTWDYSVDQPFDDKIILNAAQSEEARTRLIRIQNFPEEYRKRSSRP